MVFHVRISFKDRKNRDIIFLDLNKQLLLKKIVKPFHKGETISYDGREIDTYSIHIIRINETVENSSVLIPKIEQRRNLERTASARKGIAVITMTTNEWYVTEEGQNVTNDFIKHAPENYVKDIKIKISHMTKFQKAVIGVIVTTLISVFLINLTYFIAIPISNQPTMGIVLGYDQNRKFFPDKIDFYHDTETNGNIATLRFYLKKGGENPAILYLKVLNCSSMLSRPYEGTEFNITCQTSALFLDKDGSLSIVLKEKPELKEFTLEIEYGMKYSIYPIFGLQSFPWILGNSYRAWCTYNKTSDLEYEWSANSKLT